MRTSRLAPGRAKRPIRAHLVCRLRKKEAGRERKALRAAQVERGVERALLARLRAGTYGDIYNFPSLQYRAALRTAAAAEQDAVPQAAAEVEAEAEAEADAGGAGAHAAAGKKRGRGEAGAGVEAASSDEEQEYDDGGGAAMEAELDYASDDVRPRAACPPCMPHCMQHCAMPAGGWHRVWVWVCARKWRSRRGHRVHAAVL